MSPTLFEVLMPRFHWYLYTTRVPWGTWYARLCLAGFKFCWKWGIIQSKFWTQSIDICVAPIATVCKVMFASFNFRPFAAALNLCTIRTDHAEWISTVYNLMCSLCSTEPVVFFFWYFLYYVNVSNYKLFV